MFTVRTDNASQARSFLHDTPSPDLQVAVFDPASGLEQALDSGYSALNLFNANGLSYINLGLNLHRDIDLTSVYDYSTCRNSICFTQVLIPGIYRSNHLEQPEYRSCMRHQCQRDSWPMLHNSGDTIHKSCSNDHGPKARNDMDGTYSLSPHSKLTNRVYDKLISLVLGNV